MKREPESRLEESGRRPKKLSMRFERPDMVSGRVFISAHGKLGDIPAYAQYSLPTMVRIKSPEGDFLRVGVGALDVEPRFHGVGSSILSQIHGLFKEIAKREGIPVKHSIVPESEDSARFFESRHGYKKEGDRLVKTFMPSARPPKKLSETKEHAISLLLGGRTGRQFPPKKRQFPKTARGPGRINKRK